MSVSCEVKRTLVKSPPELWSELSDAESLARHLDGLGEIRIVRTEAERALEWEATGANGSVRLEPSGFGTKVTLSLSREEMEPGATAETEAVVEAETGVELVPIAEPMPITEPEAMPEPVSIVEPEVRVEAEAGTEPVTESQPAIVAETEPSTEPRRGFFARLFKRRHKELAVSVPPMQTPGQATAEQAGEPEAAVFEPAPVAIESAPVAIEPGPEPQIQGPAQPCDETAEPEHTPILDAQPAPEATQPTVDEGETVDVAADLATLESQIAERDEAMLAAMLDRLGAAHHRPFSRS